MNSEFELLCLWLEAAVLEPDPRLCFEVELSMSVFAYWQPFNSTNSHTFTGTHGRLDFYHSRPGCFVLHVFHLV